MNILLDVAMPVSRSNEYIAIAIISVLISIILVFIFYKINRR